MEFSVLTYNINFAYARKQLDPHAKNVLKAIKEANCDVVVLQETHGGWHQYLKQYLGQLYPHQLHFVHGGAGGQAFLSKYEFEEQCTIETPNQVAGSWFPMHVVNVLLPFGKNGTVQPLKLVNVHLRPPVNEDGSAFLFTARNTNKFRLAEVEYLAEQLQWTTIDSPTLILGDFNENDGAPALSWLQKTFEFVDALQEFVPKGRETHRWRILWGYWLLLKRLDHILYSKDLLCHSCDVIDGYEENASDHQPVFAVLSFK